MVILAEEALGTHRMSKNECGNEQESSETIMEAGDFVPQAPSQART